MPIGKLGKRRQVVIPKEICDELDLHEGDFVEVKRAKGAVLIKPKKVVDSEDVLTPEDEASIKRGLEQLKRGEYVDWDELKKRLKL